MTGISRPDLWAKAEEKAEGHIGAWGLYQVWREYWELLKAEERGEATP